MYGRFLTGACSGTLTVVRRELIAENSSQSVLQLSLNLFQIITALGMFSGAVLILNSPKISKLILIIIVSGNSYHLFLLFGLLFL